MRDVHAISRSDCSAEVGPAVSGFAEVGPALHGLRNVWSTMSAAGAGRPAKRARLEADKRRDALAEVEDKYADIDFTRFQKVVDIDTDADGEATPGAPVHHEAAAPALHRAIWLHSPVQLACPWGAPEQGRVSRAGQNCVGQAPETTCGDVFAH